ncbi:MAG TPA: hypothetical protein VMF08_18985 [Candidatus Sulfotelmatobacter sp.]|nr:hypothetical protein [Candidatus Sulfotelmatobacter sp.]
MNPRTENVTEWFKRLSTGGKPSGTPSVSLAAFGKHPGWEDHIPGIGVDTEALANLKQSLYFDGIRGQVDAGAWEKMEQIKRIEGFDHLFLWLRPGRVFLGMMWSSSDRIGRAKYPMILCAEGDGFTPAFMLANAKPEMERLRDACKTLASAEEVTAECRMALDRLRGTCERAQGGWTEPFLDTQERQRFLDCAELAPDRTGFLRILHEYLTEQGIASEKKTKHLRVPAITSVQTDGFTPWVEFFKCIVPAKTPVLFVKRNGEAWLDVVVGEPASHDFFCLQAATDALPLATQIPYDISPDTISTLDAVASRLGLGPDPVRQSRPQAPVAPVAAPGIPAESKSGAGLFLLIGIVVIVIVAGVVLWLLKAKTPPAKNAAAPANKTQTASPTAAQGVRYESAIQSATDAFTKGNYDEAIRQADIALDCEPGDQVATQIKADSVKKKKDAESQASTYSGAMSAARNALAAGNYDEAVRQVKNALAFNPGDSAAMTLDATIEARQDADTKLRQEHYDAAMASGRAALASKNYSEVSRQAGIALNFKAGDSDAKDLMAQAQNAQSAQQRNQKYDLAMQSARQAFGSKNYPEAIQKANDALMARPDDADATALKSKAQVAQASGQAYQTAMQAAQTAFNNKNYAAAVQRAANALQARPGDVAATTLRDNAISAGNIQKNGQQYESEINALQAAWNRNDFDAVIQHANLALQLAPNEPDIKSKLRDSVYNKLEIYAVWFGVIKPQDATFQLAKRASPLAQGNMPPSQANAFKNQIDAWLKLLGRYQLGDDAHTKLAQAIEQNIDHY